MKRLPGSAAAVLLVLCTLPVAMGQSIIDERQAIRAALEGTLPLVSGNPYFVFPNITEPLHLGSVPIPSIDGARMDYASRNREPLTLTSEDVPVDSILGSVLGEVSGFSAAGYDWSALEQKFGKEWSMVRVSRPGFVDESNAVVRIEVWQFQKPVPLAIWVVLTKLNEGGWKVKATTARADPADQLSRN